MANDSSTPGRLKVHMAGDPVSLFPASRTLALSKQSVSAQHPWVFRPAEAASPPLPRTLISG